MTLQSFELPDRGIAEYDEADLSATSFTPEVRAFHVDRLPRYDARIEMITCAYCGKPKEIRSMRVDHIIPIRVWTRYRCHRAIGSFGGRGLPYARPRTPSQLQRTISLAVAPAARAAENLLLCCAKCNGYKSDDMPDDVVSGGRMGDANPASYHQRALANSIGDPLNQIVLDNQRVMKTLRRRSALNSFILNGYGGNVRNSDEPDHIIQRELIGQVYVSRPPMMLAELVPILKDRQKRQVIDKAGLRLCLYCLGFYQKQAFSLDHIRPVLRGRRNVFGQSQATRAGRYNEPSNIVAVCASCNSSKSSKAISMAFIRSRVEARAAEGLTGIESVPGMSTDIALAQVKRIFDL